jgi:hypothetical protein
MDIIKMEEFLSLPLQDVAEVQSEFCFVLYGFIRQQCCDAER